MYNEENQECVEDCTKPVQAPEVPEVEEKLKNLSEAVNRLNGKLKHLSEKLKPVLTEENPREEVAGLSDSKTGLGREISKFTADVFSMSDFVEDLMQRMEI
jgi:ubiquinone biosynthesis protein UbiJ